MFWQQTPQSGRGAMHKLTVVPNVTVRPEQARSLSHQLLRVRSQHRVCCCTLLDGGWQQCEVKGRRLTPNFELGQPQEQTCNWNHHHERAIVPYHTHVITGHMDHAQAPPNDDLTENTLRQHFPS